MAPVRNGFRVRQFLDAPASLAHGMGSVVVEGPVELVNVIFRGKVPLLRGGSPPSLPEAESGRHLSYHLWENPQAPCH